LGFLGKPSSALLIGCLALLVALAAGGVALANGSSGTSSTRGTVEVTGQATVMAKPDTLTVDLTVSVVNAASSKALTTTDNKMRALQHVFLSAGIAAKDQSTTNVSVNQNTNSNGKPDGYIASEDLSVTIHELSIAGRVLATASSTIGNDLSIDDTNYSLSNPAAPLNSARTAAMANAKQSASVLARAVGEHLGPVVRITDQSTTTPVTFGVLPEAARAANVASVPLQPGTQPVKASVDVVFSVQS
jgi:hypothetical protein